MFGDNLHLFSLSENRRFSAFSGQSWKMSWISAVHSLSGGRSSLSVFSSGAGTDLCGQSVILSHKHWSLAKSERVPLLIAQPDMSNISGSSLFRNAGAQLAAFDLSAITEKRRNTRLSPSHLYGSFRRSLGVFALALGILTKVTGGRPR